MWHQIKRVDTKSLMKFMAGWAFVSGVIYIPFMLLKLSTNPDFLKDTINTSTRSLVMVMIAIMVLVAFPIAGAIGGAVNAILYNSIAKRGWGIKVQLEESKGGDHNN